VDPDPRSSSTGIELGVLLASFAVPLLVAASRVSPFAGAAHDEAVVRALGLGWTGAWRALDVPVSSLFLLLPLGTRALRAALAGALLGGLAGSFLYRLARRLVSPWVAALATSCATLSGAWLAESSAPGSLLLGVVLTLAPLWLIASRPETRAWPLLACGLAAALTYEPLVGLVACSASMTSLLLAPRATRDDARREWRSIGLRTVVGLAIGCAPIAAALLCRPLGRSRLDVGLFGAWAGEGGPTASTHLELVVGELGRILPLLGAVGAVQCLAERRLRAVGAPVVAMAVASALAVSLGAPASKEHWSAPALTLLGAVAVLAAVPMQWGVAAVARAKLPLASASAAMIVLLELTFPVLILDEGLARLDARGGDCTRCWDDLVFESLSPGSLVLVHDRGLYARALASLATGEMRPDLTFIPTFDVASRGAEGTLSSDPSLYPLWRDLVLYGTPRERTLSSVASSRPLAMEFRPTWEHGILRHLVPQGLLASFHSEPRGASERLAQEELGLFADTTPEAPLAALGARLLDARAKSLLSLGEREAATRAMSDARALALLAAPGERRARRLLTSRGRITPP